MKVEHVVRCAGAVACLVAAGLSAHACDSGTVRDAAFKAKRDIHLLCVIANAGDPAAEQTYERLDTWLQGGAHDLNIRLERVNADDDSVRWPDLGIPTVPPNLPVVTLAGRLQRRSFVIDHWEPAPSDEDLALLRTSPARERITKAILDYWGVVLYAPGTGERKKDLQSMFDAVEKKWAAEQSPGVTVVSFDRTDPGERILCAFTGIQPSGPDWAGVVFGRGKLLAPPLEGDDITEDNLNRLIGGLAVQCTCLQDSMTMGLDIPMMWNEGLDSKVTSLAPRTGYVEMTIGEQVAQVEAQLDAAIEAEVPDESRGMLAMMLVSLAGATAIAVAAVAVAAWRARRGSAAPEEE